MDSLICRPLSETKVCHAVYSKCSICLILSVSMSRNELYLSVYELLLL